MISDTEQVHRNLRDAINEISKIIDEFDYVGYKMIVIQMKLLKAEYHFSSTYLAYLSERAGIDLDIADTE